MHCAVCVCEAVFSLFDVKFYSMFMDVEVKSDYGHCIIHSSLESPVLLLGCVWVFCCYLIIM